MKTPTELYELDLWICEHALKWSLVKLGNVEGAGFFATQGTDILIHDRNNYVKLFKPSTEPSDAMLVLEKCCMKIEQAGWDMDCAMIQHWDGQWNICAYESEHPTVSAETLPLCICLFAKQLFSK